MPRVVIVGGGISGLSTAYYLRKAGVESTIVERAPRLGGVIQTETIEGCTVELGPDSFLSAKPAARELCQEIGLGGDLIGSNDAQRATFIWRDGQLIRLPDGLTMMVPGKIGPILRTPLLSWPGKLRAGADLLRRPTGSERDRSVSDFVLDHFGREVLDYIAEPLLAGVYGGDPAQMSTLAVMPKFVQWEAKYGSLTRAARKEVKGDAGPLFTTLKGGLQSMVDRLIERAQPEIVHGAVESVQKGWRVRVNGEWIPSKHLVIACRPSEILPNLFPAIPYNDAVVMAVGYRREDVPKPLPGFGLLVPRTDRKTMAACTWVGHKFQNRVPDDKVLLRCFMTSAKVDPLPELREKFGISAKPLFVQAAEWPKSMPQYHLGHRELVEIIDGMVADLPGLHVTGNAYHGIGIPDCIRIAKQVAERIAANV